MKKNWGKTLAIALILCLVGAFGASVIQSDFGRVEITDVVIRTSAGEYTGYLFVPENATPENPAPAIVTSHGYLNNREMQDLNYVELARRGYVVFAQDAYNHGNSGVLVDGWGSDAQRSTAGMVDAVEYLSALDFVDDTRIGVTGHSMGGGYSNATAAYYSGLEREALANGATAEEAKALNKVAACLIVGNYPLALSQSEDTTGNGGYLCDLGIIAGQFDEFYPGMSGYYGYELLTNENTQNLVAVQTGVSLNGAAEEGKFYQNAENGYILAFYNPAEFHALNHFSPATVGHIADFFEETLGAPNPMPGSNQTWWIKEAFNLVGLIGFFGAIVPLAALMLELPFFASLKKEKSLVVPALADKKAKGKYIRTNIISGLLSAILLLPLLLIGYVGLLNPFFPQDTTGGIAFWSLGCGLLAWLMLRVGNGKLKGRGEEFGVTVPKGTKRKTLLLALAVVAATFMLVFIADYVFMTDFRIWTLDIRVFDFSKIIVALKYLPFFLVFYVINSVSCNRNCFEDWSEKKQIMAAVGFNIFAPTLFLLVTYVPVIFTKMTIFGGLPGMLVAVGALIPILVIPFVPILGIAGYLSVKLQKLTGNIWLGGLVNAMLITMITVANTSFTFPY
ncbi:MAG: dienelactone hydrolase family protein [Agathobacter sp.]|nr:dienelactone hydrolase family protein [Agathobacter sp.]